MKILKWIKSWIKTKPSKPKYKDITFGEQDERGFCEILVDGEKSNVKILVWSKEQIDRIQNLKIPV